MANIVLGIGSSHGPQLGMPPELWPKRGEWDRTGPELWYKGHHLSFDEVLEERSDQHLEGELLAEKAEARFAACQRAIARLAATLEQAAPDVAVIIGDDQHEAFLDDNMPAFGVFWGETVDTCPPQAGEMHTELGTTTSWGRFPEQRTTNPGAPDLGLRIIQSLVQEGFDPTICRTLPAGRKGDHGIGHAFSYVYRRLMNDRVVPNVPIFLNTYFPPNQPTLERSYQLGQALRRAIERWDSDQRVAVIASGGLSHFVIEEELDQSVLSALREKDSKTLTSMRLNDFNSGSSEMRNWVVLAGAMEQSDFRMELVDYVPCYRSLAGTGCAMGFAEWK